MTSPFDYTGSSTPHDWWALINAAHSRMTTLEFRALGGRRRALLQALWDAKQPSTHYRQGWLMPDRAIMTGG